MILFVAVHLILAVQAIIPHESGPIQSGGGRVSDSPTLGKIFFYPTVPQLPGQFYSRANIMSLADTSAPF